MKFPKERIEMSRFSVLGDILLLVIGFNTLVILTIAQPNGGIDALVGTLGVAMILIGSYRTAREVIWPP
jgi:hypothetical protein